MSLMRLLAVGSSIRGIKDRPSPYKMTQQHLLPKFGVSKPGETKCAEAAGQDPASEASHGTGTPANNEGTKMLAAEQAPKQAHPAMDSISPSASPETAASPSHEAVVSVPAP